MTLTAHQIRQACALLAWTPLRLAGSAVVSLDEVKSALNDVSIGRLGGLQISAIRQALEAVGVVFIGRNGSGPSARLRKVEG